MTAGSMPDGPGRPGDDSKGPTRARLGVFKFTSCDGCQLTILDCEDDLLPLAETVEIVYFQEAKRGGNFEGPFDLSLVEGSISTPHQAEQIRKIRERSDALVAMGACATAGGIQALKNFSDVDEFRRVVYARPEVIDSLPTSTPISDHVRVEFEVEGCPPNKAQLLEVISAFLNRRRPEVPPVSVCMECKMDGNVCVLVAHGTPCMGPVTRYGCGAICPSYDRGCYGCFGPKEIPNTGSLSAKLEELGESPESLKRAYRTFNAWKEDFRAESERQEEGTGRRPVEGEERRPEVGRVEGTERRPEVGREEEREEGKEEGNADGNEEHPKEERP